MVAPNYSGVVHGSSAGSTAYRVASIKYLLGCYALLTLCSRPQDQSMLARYRAYLAFCCLLRAWASSGVEIHSNYHLCYLTLAYSAQSDRKTPFDLHFNLPGLCCQPSLRYVNAAALARLNGGVASRGRAIRGSLIQMPGGAGLLRGSDASVGTIIYSA